MLCNIQGLVYLSTSEEKYYISITLNCVQSSQRFPPAFTQKVLACPMILGEQKRTLQPMIRI